MEDFAYIIDYLPQGLPDRVKRAPIAYSVGEGEFKLLELIPKPDVVLKIGERVFIGKNMEKRAKIAHVKRRVGYPDLTSAAQAELPYMLIDIVKKNEKRFVKFFNDAGPVTTRMHVLEILPNLGRKTLLTILEERKKAEFKSFEDITTRVNIRHPESLVAKRIEIELSETPKYRLFVK